VKEEPLTGGNLNPVVRRGDTVRRPAGPWTRAVHALLDHLEARGFDGAPRALGIDAQGREILSFVEGDTGDANWSDESLVEAMRLIRRFHDACRGFRPPDDAAWQTMVGAPHEGAIVCHNDLAPYNAIYRDGLPVAFVDWELASPGPPLWDVAYAAWRFVPFYPDVETDRPRRLRLLADAYGLSADERAELVPTIERRIRCSYETLAAWSAAGRAGWTEMARDPSHAEGMLRSLALVTTLS
jgi:Ser/Thr protein kinase RdoA (MazF antagonist)